MVTFNSIHYPCQTEYMWSFVQFVEIIKIQLTNLFIELYISLYKDRQQDWRIWFMEKVFKFLCEVKRKTIVELDRIDMEIEILDIPGMCYKRCSCDQCRQARRNYAPYMEKVHEKVKYYAMESFINTKKDLLIRLRMNGKNNDVSEESLFEEAFEQVKKYQIEKGINVL